MSFEPISRAIQERRVIRFHYTGDTTPGYRFVEPHMVAYNSKNHLALSGWLQAGVSGSGGGGWREYLIASVSDVTVMEQTFQGPRPGYRSDGGKSFHNIQSRL